MCDNSTAFTSIQFTKQAYIAGVIMKYSSNYYPQGNSVVESLNKNIMTIIWKILHKNQRDWHTKLKYALWSDHIRIEATLGTSPFHLIYGQDPIFPVHLNTTTIQFMRDYLEADTIVETRLVHLMHLDEKRKAFHRYC